MIKACTIQDDILQYNIWQAMYNKGKNSNNSIYKPGWYTILKSKY
jgi:hypothetical protein